MYVWTVCMFDELIRGLQFGMAVGLIGFIGFIVWLVWFLTKLTDSSVTDEDKSKTLNYGCGCFSIFSSFLLACLSSL